MTQKGCFLPCITHHFRKQFCLLLKTNVQKGFEERHFIFEEGRRRIYVMRLTTFQTLFLCDSFETPNKQRWNCWSQGQALAWLSPLKFSNSSKVFKPINQSQVQSPNNSHAPHTPNTQHPQAHAQHFRQKHQIETKQLTDFCFAFSQVKRFARIGQLIRTLKWSLLCLFLLITNSTDPTTTATNKKCVFWWCDVWPSATALVGFHTKHKAENAIRLSWMGLFRVRWKQACFFSFQNRVVRQRTRLDQCHCSGVVVVNWAQSAVFWKSHKNWKNRKKRSFFCGPKLFLPFSLICWTKTETQQNKKGKKKKLKHQSFVLRRGSETMTRLLLSCWCFAEFLAALCFIVLWRRGLCECLGKHAWYFEMYPHPSCFRKGHCDLYQCLPSLLCDCGPFWVVTSFCCVSFQFGQVFRVEVPLHYVCHVSCQDSMNSSAAVDVKLLSSWFTVFIGLNSQFASFLVWNSFVVSLVVTTTPIALHPELIETPFFWWFTWSPSTTNCKHTGYSHLFTKKKCWIVDSVVLFLLSFFCFCFFFFGCLGGLIEVTQCWSLNPHWCVCFVNNKQ